MSTLRKGLRFFFVILLNSAFSEIITSVNNK